MLAVRGHYENGHIKLLEPIEGIETAEVMIIISEKQDNDISTHPQGIGLAKLQESTGFARNVLANPAEDIWNEL